MVGLICVGSCCFKYGFFILGDNCDEFDEVPTDTEDSEDKDRESLEFFVIYE